MFRKFKRKVWILRVECGESLLESLKRNVGFCGWNVESLWGKRKNFKERLGLASECRESVREKRRNVESLWGKSENLRLNLRATDGGKWRATNGKKGGRRWQNVVFLYLWV